MGHYFMDILYIYILTSVVKRQKAHYAYCTAHGVNRYSTDQYLLYPSLYPTCLSVLYCTLPPCLS